MSVPIALCASPPSGVCSTPHPCQINSHSSSDYELNHRSGSATVQKPAIVGGLSCLFSSPSVKHASTNFVADELSSRRHGCSSLERGEDLCSSFCYSSIGSSIKGNRDQSPVSVFQGPVSCSSVGSRSPPVRITREQNPFRVNRDGFINGFFRNALGSSCFDYDSPIFPMPGGSSLRHDDSLTVEEEFTFNLEDTFIETNRNSCVEKDQSGYLGSYNLEPYARSMLSGAQSRHKIFSEEFVIKAFCEAEKAHMGQMRASGDPYLQHCVETAVFLAAIGADTTVVAAGLLHDTLDDTFMDYDYILQAFGVGVADLVEGVSKLSQLSKLARENNTASKTVEADRLHTMFLAMADARAVLIKLADRLHNMVTLEALPLPKQRRFAKETLEIFSPLANRLGISTWKEQLENLCFKHLNPLKHHELASKLIDPSREAKITSAIEKLDQALKNESVPYHVLSGRHKSLYSIFSKMSKKKLSMDEIHDIHGLRLIVENEDDCYRALRIVHHMWPQVQGKLKDYIAHPKFNGYRSLHTVVLGEDMVPLEVQIRTREMHLQAEFGFAAHWRYKEGECKHSSFILQMVEWARWVVTWQCETGSKDHHRSSSLGTDSIRPPCPFPSHSEDCPYSYLPHCNQDGPVFVIMMENEKMSVLEFAANSTVRDLLERVGRESSRWSSYSRVLPVKEELRPRLNHLPVSDTSQKLKMGDVVELTPAIPDKALTECREEIQRMFDRDLNIAVPS